MCKAHTLVKHLLSTYCVCQVWCWAIRKEAGQGIVGMSRRLVPPGPGREVSAAAQGAQPRIGDSKP